MDIVFATATLIVSDPKTGSSVSVNHGTHWPADDPVVRAYPEFFTNDPRYGLSSSLPLDPEGYPVTGRPRSTPSTAGATETATAAPGEKRTRK